MSGSARTLSEHLSETLIDFFGLSLQLIEELEFARDIKELSKRSISCIIAKKKSGSMKSQQKKSGFELKQQIGEVSFRGLYIGVLIKDFPSFLSETI